MLAENRELELKFELDAETFEKFRTKPVLRKLTRGRAASKTLHSVYFDTDDHALHAAGIALRVRHIGAKRIQTVKAKSVIIGGLSNPVEAECDIGRDRPVIEEIPDIALRERVRDIIGERTVEPVCATEMRRTTRMLESAGGTIAELALDRGEVRAGDRTAELCEVELELVSGDALGLLDLVQDLFDSETLHLSNISKAQRGYLLAADKTPDFSQPLFSDAVSLSKKQSGDEALGDILSNAAEQISHNFRVVRTVDAPEGAHQLRVGLRRLRSILRVIRALGDNELADSLNNDARDLGSIIGKLRDADVMLADIVEPVRGHHTADRPMDRIVTILETQREQDRTYVRSHLTDHRWTLFQIRLALFIQACLWRAGAKAKQQKMLDKSCRAMASDALTKIWNKAEKLGNRIETLTIDERHELRKDLKKLRYQVEFFSSLYPKGPLGTFLKELKAAQDIFGYLNDVATAEGLPAICERHEATSTDIMVTIGVILGWHTAHSEDAWANARKRWDNLKKADRKIFAAG